jgi:hypothetical protein
MSERINRERERKKKLGKPKKINENGKGGRGK